MSADQTATIAALRAENDHLRASVANSGGACVFCKLPREDWAKCAEGFPGCARGDDAMLCPHVGAELETADRVKVLEAALKPFCFGDPTIERILYDGMSDDAPGTFTIKLGDIRAARAALQEPTHGE